MSDDIDRDYSASLQSMRQQYGVRIGDAKPMTSPDREVTEALKDLRQFVLEYPVSDDFEGAKLWTRARKAINVLESTLSPSPAPVVDKLKAHDEMICKMGDCIADMFEQMLRGKWQDDHGHDVQKNQQMVALKNCLMEAIKFRAALQSEPPRDEEGE